MGAAFVVWHGGVGDTEEPIAISSRTYTFTDTDRLTIRSLRQFNVERAAALGAPVGMPIPAVGQALLAADRAREEQYMRRVHTLDHGEAPFADLLCQVIGLDRRSGALVMYVWDGTDAKPYPETLTTAGESIACTRRKGLGSFSLCVAIERCAFSRGHLLKTYSTTDIKTNE